MAKKPAKRIELQIQWCSKRNCKFRLAELLQRTSPPKAGRLSEA